MNSEIVKSEIVKKEWDQPQVTEIKVEETAGKAGGYNGDSLYTS